MEVRSEQGLGTTFVLTLPVTLGVLRCLVARVGDERYAVPVPGVVESLSLRDAEVHTLAGAPVVLRHGVSVPLLDLGAALGLPRPPGRRPALPWSCVTPTGRRSPGRSTAWRASPSSWSRTSAPSSAGSPTSPAPPSTATAAWCACSTSVSSPTTPPEGRPSSYLLPGGPVARRLPYPASASRACWSSRTPSASASWSGSSSRAPATRSRPQSTAWTARPACATSPSTWCSPTWRCRAWTASP